MARILQCLVYITVMTTSARTQRGYQYQIHPTDLTPEEVQDRYVVKENHGTNPVIQSQRSQEGRSQRLENKVTESIQRIQNGTYKISNRIQVSKRGALETSYDKVVFPGPTSELSADLEIPEECRRKGYCENVPNYPNERVKGIVARLGDDVKYFTKDVLVEEGMQITQRLGGPGTEQTMELCEYKEQIIYPQSARDKNDKWYTVINPKDNYVQGFRAELCISEGSPCSTLVDVRSGYTASCKQKFVYRMVQIEENNVHVQKPLKMPSCCSCVIEVVDSLLS